MTVRRNEASNETDEAASVVVVAMAIAAITVVAVAMAGVVIVALVRHRAPSTLLRG